MGTGRRGTEWGQEVSAPGQACPEGVPLPRPSPRKWGLGHPPHRWGLGHPPMLVNRTSGLSFGPRSS